MTDKHPPEHIWELMETIGVAMIVSHTGEADEVRARPMAARPEIEDNAIYFLTDANAPKDGEIEHNSNVCLTFSDTKGERYVSVTGTAEVIESPELAERVWKSADKAFYKSPQDPNLRVIRVTPEKGEYWQGAGTIAMIASMITAGAKGKRPDLGESRKVAM